MTLDPQIADMERRWKASGLTSLYEGTGPEMRARGWQARRAFYPAPAIEPGRLESMEIAGPSGGIPARIVWPREGAPTATVVFLHGGGWIIGDLDSHHAHAVRIANQAGVVVVNVDYRLAPEHPFPAGLDDAMAVIRWVHDHLARFSGEHTPLAVAGDSAGGNLAAVAAVICRDAGIELAAQLLLYPALDLDSDLHAAVRDAYLGPDAAALVKDPRVSPLLEDKLAGLAPVTMGVGVFDPLLEENLAYARKLCAAGVQVTLREYATLGHSFFSYTGISERCAEAADELCADLRRALAIVSARIRSDELPG